MSGVSANDSKINPTQAEIAEKVKEVKIEPNKGKSSGE